MVRLWSCGAQLNNTIWYSTTVFYYKQLSSMSVNCISGSIPGLDLFQQTCGGLSLD